MDQSKLDGIVDEVARITGRNVTLDDVYSRVLAYNMSHPASDRARIESVLMKSVSGDAQTWEASLDLSRQNKPFIVPPNRDMGFLARVCIPLVYRGLRVGYVWIQARDDNDAPEPVLEAIDPVSVEAESRERVFLEFLRRKVTEPPQEAVSAVTDEARPRILVLSHPGLRTSTLGGGERTRLARQGMLDALRTLHVPVLWAATVDHVVALLPERVSKAERHSMVQRFGESLVLHGLSKGSLQQMPEAGLSTTAAGGAAVLPNLYGEALAALQARAVDPRIPAEADFGAIGIYQLFSHAGESIKARSSTLDAVLAMPNGQEMIGMLERIYDFNGPRGEIADELHIHRTSLYHRLRRIGEAIGQDPLDSFVRLDLHAALKARRWAARPVFSVDEDG